MASEPAKNPTENADLEKATRVRELLKELGGAPAKYHDSCVNACILFADLVGSTAYKQHHGPIPGMEKILRHNAIVEREIEKFGGKVVKFIGDGVMAWFRDKDASRSALDSGLSIIAAIDDDNIKRRLGFPNA